ncbi:MAG: alkylmercury lyase family protein [Candidatus Dormibacteraeota bacterium]|nr:alkylmercury lyase family protein [Candidatus Dormibacteraeota bacterium]
MLLFRSEEHVRRSGEPAGASMTVGQAWRLADRWYRDRANPNWHRRTADEAEAVFADVGLSGDFWNLRPPTKA